MNISDKITAIVEPLLEQEGMELVKLSIGNAGRKTVFQFFIDRLEGRVTLADCEKMSNVIGSALDMEQAVSGAYTLEVSSPGIDRPLTKPFHYKKYEGQKARVHLKNPLNGRNNFTGMISAVDGEGFTLQDGAGSFNFKFADIDKARLDPATDF